MWNEQGHCTSPYIILMFLTIFICHLILNLVNCFICTWAFTQNIERPYTLIEEEAQLRKANPVARVEKMFDLITSKLTKEPKLILCVLPERKNCDIYGRSLSKKFQGHLHMGIFYSPLVLLSNFRPLEKEVSEWIWCYHTVHFTGQGQDHRPIPN